MFRSDDTSLGAAGLNITVPHKQAALALAKEAEPLARLSGAANTLVPMPGGWMAHNTDVEGFLKAIKTDLGFSPANRRCLIIGAGGAARAASVGLLQQGAQEIVLANPSCGHRPAKPVCCMGREEKPYPIRLGENLRAKDCALLGGDGRKACAR